MYLHQAVGTRQNSVCCLLYIIVVLCALRREVI